MDVGDAFSTDNTEVLATLEMKGMKWDFSQTPDTTAPAVQKETDVWIHQ